MRSGIRIILVFAALLVLSGGTSGITFEAQYKAYGDYSYGYFGYSVARVLDLDGDKIDDIIVGAPGTGLAKVISGANGSNIHYLYGYGGDDFGTSVGAVTDLDGDNVADLVVGCPSGDYVMVFSGKTGESVYTVYGTNGGEYFGHSVAGVGDADGDGCGDFAVGAPYGYDANWNQTGYALVFSGKSGSTLHTVTGIKYDEFGWSVAGGFDVDGDGYDDFVVGAASGVDPNSGTTPGTVSVFSGLNGQMISMFVGKSDYSRFGASVAFAGDVDGDGVVDVIAGATDERSQSGGSGAVRVISGADGSTLHTLYAGQDEYQLGTSVCGLGDLDGDGTDEFAAGTYDMVNPEGAWSGGVRAWSGASGEELFTLYGERDSDYFGVALCALTDRESGELHGLVVGAAYDSETGSYNGCVRLLQDMSIKGKVSINAGAVYTTSREVTLNLTWFARKSEIVEVRARNADEGWGDWTDAAEEVSFSLSAAEGAKQVEVEFRDDLGATVTALSDPIILDTKPPEGSIRLGTGSDFTNLTTIPVALLFTDEVSGVYQARLRNVGGAFGAWFGASSPPNWTLTPGEGLKPVEAECRDRAGNVSALVTAAVWVDQTVPAGSVSIDDGAECALDRTVTLYLTAMDDGGAGLTFIRIKRSELPTWSAWIPYTSVAEFLLPEGDGVKSIDVQFMDGAGNISPVATDTIILDVCAPALTSFTVNTDLRYVLPGMGIPMQMAARDDPGSGVDAFRVTYDGGLTFSNWIHYTPIPMVLPNPGLGDEHPLQVMIRDRAGNSSALSAPLPLYFVDADCPRLGPNGSITGSISSRTDIDAVAMDLAKGDVLSMKVKATAAVKGTPFPLVFDMWLEDGTQIALGIPALSGYAVPRSGRCYIVARLNGVDPGLGSYSLGVSVKLAGANAKVKSTVNSGEIQFEATEGSSLKASLKGAGLDPVSVEVLGPDGAVATAASGKTGSAKLACVLDQGTGTYRIRFTASGPVTVSAGVKLPKGARLIEP